MRWGVWRDCMAGLHGRTAWRGVALALTLGGLSACGARREPSPVPPSIVPSSIVVVDGDANGDATSRAHVTAPPEDGGERASPYCQGDDDCVLTDFVACCHPCGRGRFTAVLRRVDSKAQALCSIVDCELPPGQVACSPKEARPNARAVCRSGACVLVEAR